MPLQSITLSAVPGAWRLFAARKMDANFAKFSEKVLTRDQYTCQFCGFQARQFQEVVNLDHNYHNNKLNNMVVACCFCTQCFFLEAVGQSEYGGGSLIYLPELSQNDLNGLCHVLFCAIANATSYRADAQNIYRSLKLRAQIVENKLGEGFSNPMHLGQMLIDAQLTEREEIQRNLVANLRLLPSRTRFNEQIEAWAAAALEELSS